MILYLCRYKEMAETFENVKFIPGGAALNAIRIAQVILSVYLKKTHKDLI